MSRPMESAAWEAQEDHAAQVAAECAQGNLNHEAEVMSHHQGRPTVAVQDARNGAGIPAPDPGPEIGTVI